jgi:hypothetical protein
VDIHRLFHSSYCFLNTNTAITWRLVRTARTLEAEWWQVLRGSVGAGTKGVESSSGRVWTAGFYHVTARSRLPRILKLLSRLFLLFSIFSGRGKPRITKTANTESADTGVCLYTMLGGYQNFSGR